MKIKIEKTICGRKLSLKKGVTYVAAFPLEALSRKNRDRPVTVSIMRHDAVFGAIADIQLGNFTPESAKEFVNEFNNGRSSFVGRKWTTTK